MRWRADAIEPVPLNVTGNIVALRSTAGVAQFAVRRDGTTWIVDSNGQTIDSFPAADGPVMLAATCAIYRDDDQVVLRRSDGNELRFPVPGAQSVWPMATNYVQIRTKGSSYALRIDWGHERMFQLPEPMP